MKFSIIMPCELSRLELLRRTLDAYKSYGVGSRVEFLIVSRTIHSLAGLPDIGRMHLIKYNWEGEHFCPALALNLGVKHARSDRIIITCPEVRPVTDVLFQLHRLKPGNYVCNVFDQHADGAWKGFSLVNTQYRAETPAYYFLAMFRRHALYELNGWDLDFMGGYASEDDDFGARFVRAGFRHEVLDDVQAVHQYHPRLHCGGPAFDRNRAIYNRNNENGVTRCKRGLDQL
jgi:hypothetical protein